MSSSCGDVNGWCIENQRCSSPFHSSSGKSVTQRNSNASASSRLVLLRDGEPQLAEQLRGRLGRPAGHEQQVVRADAAPCRSAARSVAFAQGLDRARSAARRAAPRSARRSPSAWPDRRARRSGCACTRCRPAPRSRESTPPSATICLKTRNSESRKIVGDVCDRQPAAQVRLVRPVPRHRLGVRHAPERRRRSSRPISLKMLADQAAR